MVLQRDKIRNPLVVFQINTEKKPAQSRDTHSRVSLTTRFKSVCI